MYMYMYLAATRVAIPFHLQLVINLLAIRASLSSLLLVLCKS